jgi:hypothetical protein
MIYYIDQSGKMESSTATVLAIANDDTLTLLIDAEEKRHAFKKLRKKYYKQADSMIGIRLFAYAAARLVALVPEHDVVVIDAEYTGQEQRIRQIIRHQLRRRQLVVPEDHIPFQRIGKKSVAHIVAIAVFRGEREADHKLKAADLLR